MSPENTHKLMGFYMDGLILGVNTMYMLFCFFKLFLLEKIRCTYFGPKTFHGCWTFITLQHYIAWTIFLVTWGVTIVIIITVKDQVVEWWHHDIIIAMGTLRLMIWFLSFSLIVQLYNLFASFIVVCLFFVRNLLCTYTGVFRIFVTAL